MPFACVALTELNSNATILSVDGMSACDMMTGYVAGIEQRRLSACFTGHRRSTSGRMILAQFTSSIKGRAASKGMR